MITKDRESVRRRARIIFISNWIHGGGSEGSLLIDGMPTREEVGGWDRGGTGPHGNYF